MRMERQPYLVGLGEALFDCIGDRELPGGAPVNVAVHANALLRGIGGRAGVASAVGADALGDRFVAMLRAEGADLSCLQVDPIHATSRVNVLIDAQGQPTYSFEPETAWDHFQCDEAWKRAAAQCDAVTFGTLAQRSPQSRAAVVEFLQNAPQAVRLYDVNLRLHFFSREIIAESLELATAAKLNADELPVVAELLGLESPAKVGEASVSRQLIEKFGLDWLAVTHGERGTSLYVGEQCYEADVPKYPQAPNADSVGAGDACSAGLLVAAALQWPQAKWVPLANALGAYVASQPGAMAPLPQRLLDLVADNRH